MVWTKMGHYALHRFFCRVVRVFIFCQFGPRVFVFCQTLSLCGTDEIIIASVDFFCILCFSSLKACLFDLSLITFKHHKAFECFFAPVPLSLSFFLKAFSLKTCSLYFLSISRSLTFFSGYFSLVVSSHLCFILVREMKTLHFCLFICVRLSKHSRGQKVKVCYMHLLYVFKLWNVWIR